MSGDGIVVSAGASDEVVLRGLTVNAQGGNNGIVFNSGAALYIENCTVRGFNGPSNANIRFAPAGASRLSLKDSFIRGGTAGVLVSNATTVAAVMIDNTRIEGNGIGLSAGTFAGSVTLRNSVFVDNLGHAISLQTGAGQALDASVDNVMVSNNAGNGVDARGGAITLAMAGSTVVRNATGVYVQGGGSAATARLTGNLISRNATGIQTGANGSILTPLSNTIEANGADGTATGSVRAEVGSRRSPDADVLRPDARRIDGKPRRALRQVELEIDQLRRAIRVRLGTYADHAPAKATLKRPGRLPLEPVDRVARRVALRDHAAADAATRVVVVTLRA